MTSIGFTKVKLKLKLGLHNCRDSAPPESELKILNYNVKCKTSGISQSNILKCNGACTKKIYILTRKNIIGTFALFSNETLY